MCAAIGAPAGTGAGAAAPGNDAPAGIGAAPVIIQIFVFFKTTTSKNQNIFNTIEK